MPIAPEIPADVMAAAREVRDEWFRNPSRITFETAIAGAILAERLRCVEAVTGTRIVDARDDMFGADPSEIASVVATDRALAAIQGPTT